jgi:predicted Fe-Mo cluster-binding NifX family protein
MNQNIGKVISFGIQLCEIIVECQRQHTKGVEVIFCNVFGKNNLQVFGRKGFNVFVVGNIYIIVPIGKTIVQRITEADEYNDANNGWEEQIF